MLEPLRAIFRERGSRYMLFVAAIFSVTAVLGKLALQQSSLTFFPPFYYILLVSAMTPIVLFRIISGRSKVDLSGRQVLLYFLLGCVFLLTVYTHFSAIAQANVAYMISIKRLSLLFGVIYGGMLFKEEKIAVRLGAALLMFIGAALVIMAR
jgi:uncharacterized membrane protein